jgi:hypothetical protein
MSENEWKQWEDLPPDEEERLIDEIVKILHKRKLDTLALMVLGSGGPLTNLFAELWMGLYGPYFDFLRVDKYVALLRRRSNVEKLMAKIEEAEKKEKEIASQKSQHPPQASQP